MRPLFPRLAELAAIAGLAAALTAGCGGGGAAKDGAAGTGGGGGATAGTSGGAGTGADADASATVDAPTSPKDVGGEASAGAGGTGGAGGAGGMAGAPIDAKADVPASVDAAPDSATAETGGACTACTEYGAATQAGRVTAAALDQLSGIAASRKNPGVLFVHNDRNTAELWAVSEAGALLATFTYTGVTVRDVEDIAVGPCPTGTCVFLADIGGNLAARPDYTIVRVPEPTVATTGTAAPVALAADRLVFTYPDGALHNAESLLVDPKTGTPYVIDKVAAGMPSTAYKLSATFGGAAIVATKIATLPVPAAGDMPATAGDAHPCGAGFLLATGNTAYEFRIAPGAPFEDAFKVTPVAVPVAQEQQREGIAYQPDGRGFFTNSEGAMQPIHHTGCK